MEVWQLMVGFGGLLVPVVLAAMARDRSLLTMIKQANDTVHDRINRVRDEYVRRDDLDGHLGRWDKQFDDLRAEMRSRGEKTDKTLDEIRNMLRSGTGRAHTA